jgi:hypothetical protein
MNWKRCRTKLTRSHQICVAVRISVDLWPDARRWLMSVGRRCESYIKFVWFDGLTAVVMKSSIFWDITQCSPLIIIRRFGGTSPPSSGRKNKPSKKSEWKLCLPPVFTLFSCSAYSSTAQIEAICSSETSADFQRTTQRYISGDTAVHKNRRVLIARNLESSV